jgi:hypothetical protein
MVCSMNSALEISSRPVRARRVLCYELLVHWAEREWRLRYGEQPYKVLWASEDCADERARRRVMPGRRLKGKAIYRGFTPVDCPYSTPISGSYFPARKVILTGGVGAFVFSFASQGAGFDALYVSAHYTDRYRCAVGIVLVPPDCLEAWTSFEGLCNNAAQHLERSQSIYVIGGNHASFKPTIEWSDVILSEHLKADLRADIEGFFGRGVDIYKQLGLPPFRKLLLVGPPGTGKTTLCAALAKLALSQKCIVVYVSAADEDGASFDKIHDALSVVAASRHQVLLIVEELDVYLTKQDKSQILNVLDGLESPNNPRGALMIATTNYPEVIDERISKRPGRVDRIVYVPPIQDEDQATRMLRRYLGPQWLDVHQAVARDLVGQTGAFVREAAIYARLLAANSGEAMISVDALRRSVRSLRNQLSTGDDLLPRRAVGFAVQDTEAAAARRDLSRNSNG